MTTLKKRLIPKLLIKYRDFGAIKQPILVTTRSYQKVFDVGDVISQAKIYEAQLADELILLNIDSHPINENQALLDLVERLSSELFMPLTIGGGVKTLDDFSLLLEHGADKVCINSSAVKNPTLITQAANQFGMQCVVVSIDFQNLEGKDAVVYLKGNKQPEELKVLDWAKKVVDLGAGEIVLTDIEKDGVGEGLNYAVAQLVSRAVSVPVILSGGCGLAEHFVDGFKKGEVEAVAAGTFFCFRDQSPMQLRSHIANAGIAIRMMT